MVCLLVLLLLCSMDTECQSSNTSPTVAPTMSVTPTENSTLDPTQYTHCFSEGVNCNMLTYGGTAIVLALLGVVAVSLVIYRKCVLERERYKHARSLLVGNEYRNGISFTRTAEGEEENNYAEPGLPTVELPATDRDGLVEFEEGLHVYEDAAEFQPARNLTRESSQPVAIEQEASGGSEEREGEGEGEDDDTPPPIPPQNFDETEIGLSIPSLTGTTASSSLHSLTTAPADLIFNTPTAAMDHEYEAPNIPPKSGQTTPDQLPMPRADPQQSEEQQPRSRKATPPPPPPPIPPQFFNNNDESVQEMQRESTPDPSELLASGIPMESIDGTLVHVYEQPAMAVKTERKSKGKGRGKKLKRLWKAKQNDKEPPPQRRQVVGLDVTSPEHLAATEHTSHIYDRPILADEEEEGGGEEVCERERTSCLHSSLRLPSTFKVSHDQSGISLDREAQLHIYDEPSLKTMLENRPQALLPLSSASPELPGAHPQWKRSKSLPHSSRTRLTGEEAGPVAMVTGSAAQPVSKKLSVEHQSPGHLDQTAAKEMSGLRPGQYAILDLQSPSGNQLFAVDWNSVLYSQPELPKGSQDKTDLPYALLNLQSPSGHQLFGIDWTEVVYSEPDLLREVKFSPDTGTGTVIPQNRYAVLDLKAQGNSQIFMFDPAAVTYSQPLLPEKFQSGDEVQKVYEKLEHLCGVLQAAQLKADDPSSSVQADDPSSSVQADDPSSSVQADDPSSSVQAEANQSIDHPELGVFQTPSDVQYGEYAQPAIGQRKMVVFEKLPPDICDQLRSHLERERERGAGVGGGGGGVGLEQRRNETLDGLVKVKPVAGGEGNTDSLCDASRTETIV